MRSFGLALVFLLCTSCGGSAKDKPIFTLDLVAIAQGSVMSDGMLAATNRIGDESSGLIVRMMVRFDISALPPGAIIVSASLGAVQTFTAGTPYTSLGSFIQLDRVNLGMDIDATDYNSPALQGIVATMTPTTLALETKTANVTSALQQDVDANFQVTDYRLYFPIGSDTPPPDDDFVEFGTGNTAFLNIEYQLP